jgi:hypothetical protein
LITCCLCSQCVHHVPTGYLGPHPQCHSQSVRHPGETPAVPPVRQGSLSEVAIVTCPIYASLLISLLAASVPGKRWLNLSRYLRNPDELTIERCGDHQRKCDGLEKWLSHFSVGSLRVLSAHVVSPLHTPPLASPASP